MRAIRNQINHIARAVSHRIDSHFHFQRPSNWTNDDRATFCYSFFFFLFIYLYIYQFSAVRIFPLLLWRLYVALFIFRCVRFCMALSISFVFVCSIELICMNAFFFHTIQRNIDSTVSNEQWTQRHIMYITHIFHMLSQWQIDFRRLV